MTDLLKRDEAEQAFALARLPTPFAVLFERSDLSVELFAPRVRDTQTPHAQDELHIVSSGTATFSRDQVYTEVKVGDLLFVPAGVDHRFERFSEDFRTWVIFFGQVHPCQVRPNRMVHHDSCRSGTKPNHASVGWSGRYSCPLGVF